MVIKTEKSQAIIDFLEKDLLINLNLLGVIENVPEAHIYVDNVDNPKGVFIKKDYFHYIYSIEDSFIDEVCDTFFKDNFYGFAGVEVTIAEKIKRKFQVNWENPCNLYYMPKENLNLELIKNNVQSVNIKDSEVIDQFYEYRHPGSIDAIKKDIEKRPSSAFYLHDEIVCWVLTHDDNSMGIMFTKEEHRRNGYGVDTAVDLAYKTMKRGKIPYLHIINKNIKSHGLAKKCGFVECGLVSWFGVIAGTPKEFIEISNQSKSQLLKTFMEEKGKFFKPNDKYDGMYLFINNIEEEKIKVPNFKICEAQDEDMINIWCELVYDSFNIHENEKECFKKKVKNELSNDDSDYKFYLGFLNGKAVTSSAILKCEGDQEDLGLYFLSTLPEERNQGIGSKMVVETLKNAKESGFEFVVTQSPEIYNNLFRKLGFIHSHRIIE